MTQVHILAPTGELGYVPQDKLAEALAAGARLMTPDDMRTLRQQIFMEHTVFNQGKKKLLTRRERKSLWKGHR